MAFTTEQFNALMASVMNANRKIGSFTTCTARYNGERNSSKVEEFVSSVTTFKNIEKIEDKDAILGMPILLEGEASEWWQGIKSKATTFELAIQMLRDAFAPPRPAWRIYAEIMEFKQQKNEPTDTFIRKKRVLFSQLKGVPAETAQIDILFSMLHSQIRDKVLRHNVKTYDDLLTLAREAEYTLAEKKNVVVNITEPNSNGPLRCSFCRKKGHSSDKCFKKQREVEQQEVMKNQNVTERQVLACYGCNTPGYVRSNCPKCSRKPQIATNVVSFNTISLSASIGNDIPTANIKLFGVPGQAYFDTGARTSVASANLKRIMDMANCKYKQVECEVVLADGIKTIQRCSTTECSIVLAGRSFNINFIILPNAESNRTLLGVDFMQQTGIVINNGQQYWYFEDEPYKKFEYAEPLPLKLNLIETIETSGSSNKRKAEIRLENDPKIINQEIYVSDFEGYGPEIEDNEYSPHVIQEIFQDCLPIGSCTPIPDENNNLFTGVVYVGNNSKTKKHVELNMAQIKIIKQDDGKHLTIEQKSNLEQILEKHKVIFGSIEEPCPSAEHIINTGDSAPISSPPYRISFKKTAELKKEIDKLLSMNIIEECESAWTSPVVMVPKRGGGMRLCIDYRKINAVTMPDKYPLPRMDDLLHTAKSTSFMSTLDLQSGYYQIKVAENSIGKTCFTTPFGLVQFLRMPFGLRNAPSTFQRLINQFQAGLPNISILAYLDDVIVCSPTFEDHMNDLEVIFERLNKFKLRLNNEKCKFCCTEVKYLGHIITANGIAVDPEKTSAISQRKEPRNVKELISFLQTCSWYRKFITQFADVAKPLTELTKKNKPWYCGPAQKEAFQKLKQALVTTPVLKQAQEGLPFVIKTDASAYAIGAVLLQGTGHDEHPIEFASRLLNSAERNYSTTEREALAIIWACAKFRGYIEGDEVILATDHQPLKWLLSIKSPTGRLARWALQIQQYNFNIEYTPGKSNQVADMLSRPPMDEAVTEILSFQVDLPHRTCTDLRENQLKDEYLQGIIKSLETEDENVSRWVNRGYTISDGILYCYYNDDMEEAQLVVPSHERDQILKMYHDDSTAGHYGIEKTIARITSRYFWPKMRADITKHVKTCTECQKYKATNLKPAGLLQTTSSKYRFEVLSVDLFGPLPRTKEGYQWILIAEDVASRWTELFPLQEATAEMCAKILIQEVFLRYGLPRRMKTDNGVQFISAIMQQVAFCLEIQQQFTPLYYPEANPVERKNRDLKAQLAILVQTNHNTWAEHLAAVRFALNTAKCQSTGYTASYLTFGRELRTMDDITHDIKSIIEKENYIPQITQYLHKLSHILKNAQEQEVTTQDKNQMLTNKSRRPQEDLQVGTQVLVNTHVLSQTSKGITSKFVPKRDGPYIIIQQKESTSYEVAAKDNPEIPLGTYHASQLTKYREGKDQGEKNPINPIRRRGRPRKN